MEPYQQRVEEEHFELVNKTTKLGVFLETEVFKTLSEIEQGLLYAQYHTMRAYVTILHTRIRGFRSE